MGEFEWKQRNPVSVRKRRGRGFVHLGQNDSYVRNKRWIKNAMRYNRNPNALRRLGAALSRVRTAIDYTKRTGTRPRAVGNNFISLWA